MGITVVTRNYQMTLPSDIREEEGIEIGDKIIFSKEDGKIVIKKLDKKGISERTFGAWKSKGSGVSYVRKLREKDKERDKRLGI